MKIFEKMKNLFTEEVEEEKEIKKEVRHVEINNPSKNELKDNLENFRSEPQEEKKEDKFVFFSDEDFKDLEKNEPKLRPVVKKEEKKPVYNGASVTPVVEEKKVFKPSPIISPVYGVLDKNYEKDEVVAKKVSRPSYRNSSSITVDDVRNRAFGTIEDELKDSILGKNEYETNEENLNEIDIFEELDKIDNIDKIDSTIDVKETYEDIFGELDNKKEEIIEELDNKKDQILDELDSKKSDIIIEEDENEEQVDELVDVLEDKEEIETYEDIEIGSNSDDNDIQEEDIDKAFEIEEPEENDSLDEETSLLSRQLARQKKKLAEINDMIDDEEVDDLDEDELFDIIDSMYDKKDDE